jgi:hypothetical protein
MDIIRNDRTSDRLAVWHKPSVICLFVTEATAAQAKVGSVEDSLTPSRPAILV